VCIVRTFNKYREQNVTNSSAMYPSTIDPSGSALLRTLNLYLLRDLAVKQVLITHQTRLLLNKKIIVEDIL
jgi:hypothetical protein